LEDLVGLMTKKQEGKEQVVAVHDSAHGHALENPQGVSFFYFKEV
jgi:hypothetical protein